MDTAKRFAIHHSLTPITEAELRGLIRSAENDAYTKAAAIATRYAANASESVRRDLAEDIALEISDLASESNNGRG